MLTEPKVQKEETDIKLPKGIIKVTNKDGDVIKGYKIVFSVPDMNESYHGFRKDLDQVLMNFIPSFYP